MKATKKRMALHKKIKVINKFMFIIIIIIMKMSFINLKIQICQRNHICQKLEIGNLERIYKRKTLCGNYLNKNNDNFYVNGNFNCNGNPISTLEGGPIEINGSYFCSSTNIKNLKGCPEKIRGSVFCNNNRFLYDIIDIPDGCTHIYMNGCPIHSIFNIFCHSNNNGGFEFVGSTTMKNLHSKINPKYLIRCLNDYEVIREDNISKYRFNQMFEELTDEKGEFKFSKELLNQYTIVE